MEAGQGSPLVFLHGAGGASWPPGLDLLCDRFHVYLPEHPGFGDTNRPEWLETVLDMAVYYLDWLAAMGLGQVTLVGQSLGRVDRRRVVELVRSRACPLGAGRRGRAANPRRAAGGYVHPLA
jgi:pimeloyl-ACP methyl ester carboxylesterase